MVKPHPIQHHLSTNIRHTEAQEKMPPRNLADIVTEIELPMIEVQSNQGYTQEKRLCCKGCRHAPQEI